MGALFKALFTAVVGLGGLLAVLGALYWLSKFLPAAWRERWQVMIFLLPALFAILIGLLVPAIRTIYTSLFNDTGKKFIGFDNYKEIFTGKDTRLTVINSLTWVIVGTTATVLVGLAIARFADGMRGERAAKSAIFIPGAISLAGAGIIWKFVYAGPPFKVGLLNQITKVIPGLPASAGGNGDQLWLLEPGVGALKPPDSAPGFNTFLLIVIFIWASAGFATVVFSAAIKGVSSEIIEAARLDGASERQLFLKVIVPMIRGTIVTVTTTVAIVTLKIFDIVMSISGGRNHDDVVAVRMFAEMFQFFNDGRAAALATVLFIAVLPVMILNLRNFRRQAAM